MEMNGLKLFDKDSANDPLNISYFAAEVIETLEEFEETNELSTGGDWVLKQALEFIDFAKHGRQLSQDLELSEDVVEATSTYGDLIDASAVLVENETIKKGDLDDIFNQYSDTIGEILDFKKGKNVSKDMLTKIRLLFKALEDNALKRSLGRLNDFVNLEDEK